MDYSSMRLPTPPELISAPGAPMPCSSASLQEGGVAVLCLQVSLMSKYAPTEHQECQLSGKCLVDQCKLTDT